MNEAPPCIASALDRDYLRVALVRAGREADLSSELTRSVLTGGRTGATVTAVRCGAGHRYVHKAVSARRGFVEALGNQGEGRFWLGGATRELPPPLCNPTLDVAYHETRDEWWLLMDDVSRGIVERDGWTEDHTLRLFAGLAELHARHWERADADALGLSTVTDTTGALAEPVAYVATGGEADGWVSQVADEFPVPRMLLPKFLDVLGDRDGAFYIELCTQWRRIAAALERHAPTVLHGDPRRANIAFLNEEVGLFDWELAAVGPAATDLTWHWFLQFWAYPPADGKTVEERMWLRHLYLDRLEGRLGREIDRTAFDAAWDLGWLRVFVQLGYCLIDPLTDPNPSSETTERVTRLCRDAIAMARGIADAHVA